MFKRIIIGLFAMSAVALLSTDANAGCKTVGGTRICAPWITGGSALVPLTATGIGGGNQNACPGVTCTQGGGEGPTCGVSESPDVNVDLKLVGTVGTNCGLGGSQNDNCGIRGVVFCGTTVNNNDDDRPRGRSATTVGPLTVHAPGFAQNDGSGHNFASFRFQLSQNAQDTLCPNTAKPYITFIPREGFFEACVDDTGDLDPAVCVRERCKVNLDGIRPEDVRMYNCNAV